MDIANLISTNCRQTAVYWGNPTNDGYGGFTFDSPVEIVCRWEDKKQIIPSEGGEELVSRTQVYVTQVLDEQGNLYLGELADLDSDETDDPALVSSAYRIMTFNSIPSLHDPTAIEYKAFL
jgi:hypothetical protein